MASPAPQKRGRGRPPKPKREVTSDPDEVPEDEEDCSAPILVRRGRGRPPRPKPEMTSDPDYVSEDEEDCSAPILVRRGRGRPPKPKPEITSDLDEVSEDEEDCSAPILVRRGRGRPPRPKQEMTSDPDPDYVSEDEEDCSAPILIRRGRGRPPNSAILTKLGRPRKVISSSVAKRPRGRPRKHPFVLPQCVSQMTSRGVGRPVGPGRPRGPGRPPKSTKQDYRSTQIKNRHGTAQAKRSSFSGTDEEATEEDGGILDFYCQIMSALRSISKAEAGDVPETLMMSIMFIQTILEHFTQRCLTLHLRLWVNKSPGGAFLIKPPPMATLSEDALDEMNNILESIRHVSTPDDISPIAKFTKFLSQKIETTKTNMSHHETPKDASLPEEGSLIDTSASDTRANDPGHENIPSHGGCIGGVSSYQSSSGVFETLDMQCTSGSDSRTINPKKSIKHTIAKTKPSPEKSRKQVSVSSSSTKSVAFNLCSGNSKSADTMVQYTVGSGGEFEQTESIKKRNTSVIDKSLKDVRVELSDIIKYKKRSRSPERGSERSKRTRLMSPKMAEMMESVKLKEEKRLARKQLLGLDMKEETPESCAPSTSKGNKVPTCLSPNVSSQEDSGGKHTEKTLAYRKTPARHQRFGKIQVAVADNLSDVNASFFSVQFEENMDEESEDSSQTVHHKHYKSSVNTCSAVYDCNEQTTSPPGVDAEPNDDVKTGLPETEGADAAPTTLSRHSPINITPLPGFVGDGGEDTPCTMDTGAEDDGDGDDKKPGLPISDWNSFRCRYCHAEGVDTEYPDWRGLQGHIRIAHIVRLNKDEEGLECPFCPHILKSFTRNFVKILYRMNIHVGKKHKETLPMPGIKLENATIKEESQETDAKKDNFSSEGQGNIQSTISYDGSKRGRKTPHAASETNKRFLGFLKSRKTRILQLRDKKMKNLFTCTLCHEDEGHKTGCFFPSKPELVNHLQNQHAMDSATGVSLTCHLCQETFNSANSDDLAQAADELLEHLLSQHDVIYLRCITAEDWKKMLEDEIPMMHEDWSGVWKCILCKGSEATKPFTKCCLLMKHIIDDHVDKDCLVNCPECKTKPRTFAMTSWEEILMLIDHFVLSHNILHGTHSTRVLYTDEESEVLKLADVPEENEPISETIAGYVIQAGHKEVDGKLKYDSRYCFMCSGAEDELLLSDGSYLEHIRNKHVKEIHSEDNTLTESALMCPRCDFEVVRSSCVLAAPGPLPHILNTMLMHMIKVHSIPIPDFTKVLYCTQCGYETLRKADYYEHLSKTHYHKACLPYGGVKDHLKSCPACEETLPKKSSWRNHRKKCVAIGGEEIVRRHRCKLCEATFAWAYQLKEHLSASHSEEERLKNTATCPECGIICCDSRALWRHRWRKHKVNCYNEELVACAKCGDMMPPSFVSIHEGEHVKKDAAQQRWEDKRAKRARGEKVDRFMPYQCSICGKKVPNRYILKNHERLHEADSTVLECGFCGYTTGSQKKTMIMKRHMEMKHGIVTHRCRVCRTCFDTQELLEAHVVEKHPEGSLVNFCTACSLQFSSKHLYQNHMFEAHQQNVSSRRVLMCPVCQFQTLGRQMLVSHMAKHKELHVPCPICGKTFSTQAVCDTHVRRYHQSKQFKCPHCEFGCNLEKTLRRHQAMHHVTTQYRCQHCAYMTYRLERFVQHMQSAHDTQIHNEKMLRDFIRDQDLEAAYTTMAPMGTSESETPADRQHRAIPTILQQQDLQNFEDTAVIVALPSQESEDLPISSTDTLEAHQDTGVLCETSLLLNDLSTPHTVTGNPTVSSAETPQESSVVVFAGDLALPEELPEDLSSIDAADVQSSQVSYDLADVPSNTLRTYTITIPTSEEQPVTSQLDASGSVAVFDQNAAAPSEPLLQTFTLPTEIPGMADGVEYVYLSGVADDQEAVLLETVGQSVADENGQEIQYIYITEET